MSIVRSLQFFILLVLPSACGTLITVPVPVPDMNLYYLKEASEAEWVLEEHFLTTGQTQVSRAGWDSISEGIVCTELSSWAALNGAVGKLCSQVTCDYQPLQILNNVMLKLERDSGIGLR